MTSLRRIARELAFFGFFLALTFILLWPLPVQLDTAVSDRGDPFHSTFIVNWLCYALTHSPLNLYDLPMFYPNKYPLAYSENYIGLIPLLLPLYLVGFSPLAIYNIAFIAGFAFSGYGGSVLARRFTQNTPAALVAGIIFAFVPYKWDHIAHLHVLFTGWVPILLAAFIAYRQLPSMRRAVLLAAAYAMNGLTGIHWLLYGSLALGMTILFWLIHGQYEHTRRFWLQLFGALAIGVLIVVPFLIPYRIVSQEYKMKRGTEETEWFSAVWRDWLVPAGNSAIYARLRDPGYVKAERELFPGLVAILLAGIGFLSRGAPASAGQKSPAEAGAPHRIALDILIVVAIAFSVIGAMTDRIEMTLRGTRLMSFDSSDVPMVALIVLLCIRFSAPLRNFFARSRFSVDEWSAALWIVIGVLGSLGLHSFFHTFLFRRVPMMQSLRVPARWAIIAYAGLAVWAALGMTALTDRRTGWRRQGVAVLVLLFLIADCWPAIRWEDVAAEPAPVYRWMKANRDRLGPFIEVPIQGQEYESMLAETTHFIPMMNGLSSFFPPAFGRLYYKDGVGEFDDEYLKIIEDSGGQYVLIHASLFAANRDKAMKWLETALAQGRLAFVRRFDSGADGDYLFAVTRNARHWQELRGPQAPDGAGHIPDENLQRLLTKQPTYSGSTFWWFDFPKNWLYQPVYPTDVQGPFRISGWTLSPAGIREVRACIDDGKKCFPAQLIERGDVLRRWPWYTTKVPRPGFIIDLPKRPKGVPRNTDFYLEIVDGNGRVTRTSDLLLYWK